ncbi:MAG: zinc ribbon domain-containing protein [Planctomycetes bacterium]|nr:zinc ribbon domain-containing protein [Planctomycetota bacterium]
MSDPKTAGGSGLVVWLSSLSREQSAAALREAKGIALCIVSGRGGGDPEPLKIGDAWMVQAPGSSGLWGRIEVRGGVVTNRFSAPDGKRSEKVAALKKKLGVPVDALAELRGTARAAVPAEDPPALETANRACRLKIFSVAERPSYGGRAPAAGRKELVLDAEFENTIPMTLVQSNQVPTMYRIKELGDHLYLVVNGNRVSRLYPDASSLPGHVATTGFTLDRLGTRARGNLVYEIPAEGVETLDLRFYDYAHGHMAVTLKPGARAESKPLVPLQENEVLEAGIFRAERVKELGGRKAPEGMTFLRVEIDARSRMFTEGDATAFDPKAKPGDKLQIGTVSDWTDLRRHLNVVLDAVRSYGPLEALEIGEAPRFIPDLLTGGTAAFLIPEKSGSLEIRCDFPNARLPDGKVVHPKALSFLMEGRRPEGKPPAAIAEIDDEIYKVAILGQSVVPEFAGVKAPPASAFLVLDVSVTGAGTAGEMFQTVEQLHYATEKGAQLAMHDATFKGPNPPVKLHLVPTGERRVFQAVFAIPAAERRPRLAYKGVTKAVIVDLKPLEGAAPEAAKRLCPKCKTEAAPNEKFCAECGTRIDPK